MKNPLSAEYTMMVFSARPASSSALRKRPIALSMPLTIRR